MPSKDIFNYALKKIEELDITLIAPQHGSIIEKKYISKLIEDMKDLDCGLYIEEKYNDELLDTIDKLQESQKTIQEKDRQLFEQSKRAEMGEMIGNIAHQWRQPLAIINTVVGILKEKNSITALSQEELKEKLEKMQTRILYMSDTIEDFMNYFRPDKEKSTFKIIDALNQALEVSHINNKTKLAIVTDNTLTLHGLKNEYIQVIVSILSNINDLIVDREVSSPEIEISLKLESGDCVLSISDNLGGIKDENISKIFNPYFTTKHQSMGTGLGLYIAKMIIEDTMNGSLRASNIEDKVNGKAREGALGYGAVFTIRTPYGT